jgi:hypothetical protein
MIKFDFDITLLCGEIVSNKDFEHALLNTKDFFFLLEAKLGYGQAIF